MNPTGKRWLEFAGQDLQMAELALSENIFNQVCFHSHQCIEKCLKALIAHADQKTPRTHSIVDLLGLLPENCFGDLGDAMEDIDIYYIPTRYPDALPGSLPEGLPGKDDGENAIHIARECWKKVNDPSWLHNTTL